MSRVHRRCRQYRTTLAARDKDVCALDDLDSTRGGVHHLLCPTLNAAFMVAIQYDCVERVAVGRDEVISTSRRNLLSAGMSSGSHD